MIQAKICGLCRPQDAAIAAAWGADYLGVILTPGHARSQTLESAQRILEAASGVRRVGVLIDPTVDEARDAHRKLALDVVQLHGHESPEFVRQLSEQVPVWKAVRARVASDVQEALDQYGAFVQGLLLDAFAAAGGSGRQFDWNQFADVHSGLPPDLLLIVAGGLNPENVNEAITQLRPDIVDVSSGVEETVCEKSEERVRAFLAAVRSNVMSPGD